MMSALEWSGWQQIQFLFESIPCGVVLGLLFEMTSGFVRFSAKKWTGYFLDALQGVLSAIITFFAALVTMDGQLHPLLFIGVVLGFGCERFVLARVFARVAAFLTGILNKVGAYTHAVFRQIFL